MKKLASILGIIGFSILILTCKKEEPVNQPPEISEIQVSPTEIVANTSINLTVIATDPEGDKLEYTWSCPKGSFISTIGQSVNWTAPDEAGSAVISVTVSDGKNTEIKTKSIDVHAAIGSLTVSSTPNGASIFLDNVDTKNITPFTFNNLPLGKKIVSVNKMGFIPDKDTISINIQYKKTSTANFTLIPTANISGFVYYAGTKIPVSGVTVTINNKTFTTSSTGSYSITDIKSGNTTLTAAKPDYDPYSKSITLNAGENKLNIDMTSGIYTHTINGSVKTSIGTIIPGVSVTLLNEDESITNILDQTDASGNYQLPAVPQGQRKLSFSIFTFNSSQKDIFVSNSNRIFDVVLSAKLISPPIPSVGTNTLDYNQIKWSVYDGPEFQGFIIYKSKDSLSNYIRINSSLITQLSNPPINGFIYYNDNTDNSFTKTYYKISVLNIDSYEGPSSKVLGVDPVLSKPFVTTNSPVLLSSTSATVGGKVSNGGGALVTERGIFWGNMHDPETTGTKVIIGNGVGEFSKQMNGLTIGSTYYVKAYAKNIIGTSLGQEVSFTAIAAVPSLLTLNISSVTTTTVICGGNISSDGGATIVTRGLCWGLTTSPTINNDKTINGAGLGQFIAEISGLLPDKTYYVRSYATNSSGTAYGNEKIFRTYAGIINDIDGNNYYTVTIGSQRWLAENLETTKLNDGTNIELISDPILWWTNHTSAAYCWYNNDKVTNKPYGALYDYIAVMTGKLCPTGWHVPSINELNTLIDYLGGIEIAGDKLIEPGTVHWNGGYGKATNESGFTALGGGSRGPGSDASIFGGLGASGCWWTASNYPPSSTQNYYLYLRDIGEIKTHYYSQSHAGYSVRCIKD